MLFRAINQPLTSNRLCKCWTILSESWTPSFALASLVLALSSLSSEAKTVTAASLSSADVQAAVNSAANGDTVQIPAGSASWSSTVNIAKGITLLGAGTDQTTINMPGSGSTFVVYSPSLDMPVRISGITIIRSTSNSYVPDMPAIALLGSSARGSGVPITQFRIDHCAFTGGKRTINPVGWCYGVIDHCSFNLCNLAVGITADDNQAWSRPVELGTVHAVVVEDCTFYDNDSNHDALIYQQEGCRSVIRNCVFTIGSGEQVGGLIDAHGNQNYITGTTSDFRGQVSMEIYGNTFSMNNGYRVWYFRAGTILAYNNTLTVAKGSISVIALTEEEGWQTQFFNPLRTKWPAQDQISNSFFWNNTLNGAPVTGVALWNGSDATFIQKGRDYWMEAPNTGNGSPSGVFASYEPLVYPHPLVSAGVNPNPVPTPPANLRIVSGTN